MTNFDNRELTIDELDVVAGGKMKESTLKELILINRPPPPLCQSRRRKKNCSRKFATCSKPAPEAIVQNVAQAARL